MTRGHGADEAWKFAGEVSVAAPSPDPAERASASRKSAKSPQSAARRDAHHAEHGRPVKAAFATDDKIEPSHIQSSTGTPKPSDPGLIAGGEPPG